MREVRPGVWRDGEPTLRLLTITWADAPSRDECEISMAANLVEGAKVRSVIVNGQRFVPDPCNPERNSGQPARDKPKED